MDNVVDDTPSSLLEAIDLRPSAPADSVSRVQRLPLDTQPMMQSAARLVSPLTGARRVSILLLREDGEMWVSAAEGLHSRVGRILALDPGVAAEVLRTQRPLLIRDLSEEPFPIHPERGYSTRSCMAVPVAWEESLYGVICAADPARGVAFTPEDLTCLHLLGQHLGASLNSVVSSRAAANVDGLTGVPTRRAFEERLAAEGERSGRFGSPVSLLLLDIDNLKLLNEREGHGVGDQALRRVARAVQETFRRVDLVARFGGDEFAVILPETPAVESLLAARRLAQKLREFPIATEVGGRVAIRAAIGVATMPPAAGHEELLEQSQRALHAAKGDREGLRHWDLGSDHPKSVAHPCTCRSCGKIFLVNSLAERRSRRYCSSVCSAAARRQPRHDRNQTILELRKSGMTLKAIAERYDISEERVRQICCKV